MFSYKYFDTAIYAYVEKVHGDTVLIDFVDSSAFGNFLEVAGLISSKNTIEAPSMILICNYNQKKVKEGMIYELNRSAIIQLVSENGIVQYQEESYIVGFQINMKDSNELLFGKSKSFSQIDKIVRNLELYPRNEIPSINVSGALKVLVRNVGQGSWNEIVVNNKTKLIFDLGTHYLTKKADIQNMLKDKEQIFIEDKPGVVISHWDIDHYHYLLGLSDEALKSISFFCARNYLPTKTSRMIYFRILHLIGKLGVYPVEPFPKLGKSSGYAKLHKLDPNAQNLIYYNSTHHRNRNQNAICIAIRRANSSIILPADTHYEQISNCILPDLDYDNNHYLVVPHHGGKAGKFKYSFKKIKSPQSAIVSVGRNNYGHPIHEHIQNLRGLGFKILQTDSIKQDIEVVLN